MVTSEGERFLTDLRNGCRETCAAFIRDYSPRVYRFLLHLTHDPALAEDLTQDTFSTAWEKIGGFAGRSSLGSWLHRIAYLKFVDLSRRSRRGAQLRERIRRQAPTADTSTPLDAVIADDQARRLYDLLPRLQSGDRTVLVLHYLQGLSYQEMADVLREPANTVKWRVRAALARLRGLFEEATRHEQEPIE